MAWGTIAAPPLLEPGPGGFFSLDLSWRRWDSEQGLGVIGVLKNLRGILVEVWDGIGSKVDRQVHLVHLFEMIVGMPFCKKTT
jgi:hypothetical protein